MQPWWAEDTSLKNINNFTNPNILLIPNFILYYIYTVNLIISKYFLDNTLTICLWEQHVFKIEHLFTQFKQFFYAWQYTAAFIFLERF